MDKYFLSEEAMVPFLTRAIQEQQAQIETLKSEIAELKSLLTVKVEENNDNENIVSDNSEDENKETTTKKSRSKKVQQDEEQSQD